MKTESGSQCHGWHVHVCARRARENVIYSKHVSAFKCARVTASSVLIGFSVCMFWVESLIHCCGGHLVWNWRMETKLRFLDEVLARPDGSLCSSLAAQLLAAHINTHMLMHEYMCECIQSDARRQRLMAHTDLIHILYTSQHFLF